VAVRLPQHRHGAPREKEFRKLHSFPCGAWGCLIAYYIKTLPKRGKRERPTSKKNKKKKVKLSSGFKK